MKIFNMREKSDEIAIHQGEKGNKYFKEREYLDALVSYNRALCYAESSSQLAITFANRSAVYMENKQYEAAVNNIEIARELDPYSKELKHLGDRYRQCMKFIRAKKKWINDPQDPIWEDPSQLKLSYPKNPLIPFVVNNINVRAKKVDGDADPKSTYRSLFAVEPLKAGDIIGIETSMINLVTEVDRYRRCCWCASTRGNLNLIPCLKTASLMFCSLKCRNETYSKMPDDQLFTLIDDSDGANPLIFAVKFKKYLQECLFDFDLSKGLDDNLKRMLTLCNIKRKEDGRKEDEPYTKIFHFTYHNQLLNYGYSLVGSLFRHSCDPNVAIMTVDNKFIFYVCRPIKKGEDLEICYGTEYFYQPRKERMESLFKNCGVICSCDACIKDFPVFIPEREVFISPMTQSSIKMIFKSLEQNWNTINIKGAHYVRGKEMCTAQDMIWQLMQEIGHYLTYGFFGPTIS